MAICYAVRIHIEEELGYVQYFKSIAMGSSIKTRHRLLSNSRSNEQSEAFALLFIELCTANTALTHFPPFFCGMRRWASLLLSKPS